MKYTWEKYVARLTGHKRWPMATGGKSFQFEMLDLQVLEKKLT